MCPIEWDAVDDEHWLIVSRCGECGIWSRELVSNEQAEHYDLVLNRHSAQIAGALARIERERMEHELEALVNAFDRDLIDAADFSH